jgi:sn1-specific diacylglycerol lipase
MPHLELCNRALPLGSDDFACLWNTPTYVYHTIWLGLLLGAYFPYYTKETNEIINEKIYDQGKLTPTNQQICISLARTWLTYSFVFLALTFVVAIATTIVSSRGPIFMEPIQKNIRDCWVRFLISLQAFLGFIEFSWGITGCIVYGISLQKDQNNVFGAGHSCLQLIPVGSSVLLAACIFVLCRRLISLGFFCGCIVSGSEEINVRWLDVATRNPSTADSGDSKTKSLLDGEHHSEGEDKGDVLDEIRESYRRTKYSRRCRNICRCFCVDDESAFEDIGRLLSDFFADFDVVTTDMAAMLYAVHIDQYRRGVTSNSDKLQPENALHGTEDQQALCQVVDNFRFGYGVYGWMLHMYDGIGSCSGCRLMCCGCHCCDKDIHSKRAECCSGMKRCTGYNTAAMVEMCRLQSSKDVIYVSWKNDAQKFSPYALMVDHETKQVIVACRGTLSMSDCLTDAIALDLELTSLGDEFHFNGRGQYGHKGIFGKGVNIARHLIRMGYLHRLMRHRHGGASASASSGTGNTSSSSSSKEEGQPPSVVLPPNADRDWLKNLPDCNGYELLITGHSLGAGLATVVSLCLKAMYPELVCYAYSPPGGMLTLPLALETKEYITTCVVGDDMVSRLGLRSIFALREKMFAMVPRMKSVNKSSMLWSILMGSDVPQLGDDGRKSNGNSNSNSNSTKEGEEGKDSFTGASKKTTATNAPSMDQTRIPKKIRRMYPPGKIIHIKTVSETRPCLDTCCCNGCCCLSAVMGVGERQLKAVYLEQHDLQDIVVTRTMASDHFPDRVDAALKQIRPTGVVVHRSNAESV